MRLDLTGNCGPIGVISVNTNCGSQRGRPLSVGRRSLDRPTRRANAVGGVTSIATPAAHPTLAASGTCSGRNLRSVDDRWSVAKWRAPFHQCRSDQFAYPSWLLQSVRRGRGEDKKQLLFRRTRESADCAGRMQQMPGQNAKAPWAVAVQCSKPSAIAAPSHVAGSNPLASGALRCWRDCRWGDRESMPFFAPLPPAR